MVDMGRVGRMLLRSVTFVAFMAALASGAVPSTYKGKPYPLGSAPKEVPGRINFHDYDAGGPQITFKQDDMASGHWGGCSAGLRDTGALKDGDPDHPSFTMTNHFSSPSDTFYAPGVNYPNGVGYPSPDTSFAANDWYIGAVHPTDWFNITVHVAKPGKYWISAFWTAMETSISYQISFIGTQYAATNDTINTNVVNLTGYNSYHAWRKYADFASIQLDSGVQIVHFHVLTYHLNLDFLSFSADSGKFPTFVAPAPSLRVSDNAGGLSLTRETIRFTVRDAGKTKIAVFDCLGREVAKVLDGELAAGNHAVPLPRASLKRGIYFIRLEHAGVYFVEKFQSLR